MKELMQAMASRREDEVNRISNLPDPILHLILSHIPTTEEAIRTSILSRRWRYLWTSVPSIDIDYARGLKSSQEFKRNEFKEFVSWVLANKSLDLDSFRLRCSDCYNMSTIYPWIDATVMRKVKLLDLMFFPIYESEDIELPQCLVTCGSLEVLRLCFFGSPLSSPKFTGFPALRVLELREVNLFDDNVVKYFIESCPLLEDLSLLHCRADFLLLSSLKLKNLRIDSPFYNCDSLEICCPKLEFLMLRGNVSRQFLFESLYSLKNAVIHPEYIYDVKAQATPSDLFAKISHVEYLSISLYCISEFFDIEGHAPISLPNLKTLEIKLDSNRNNMDALIPFLKCLPDLESLHLIIPKDKDAYGLDELNLEEAETINILTRHLKKVEFLKFNGKKLRLDVARALLEHGNVLEEMVFSWDNEAMFHKWSVKTMKNVSKFHKTSSTVKFTAVINPTQPNPTIEIDSIQIKSSSRG